jgi:hypothetical protein
MNCSIAPAPRDAVFETGRVGGDGGAEPSAAVHSERKIDGDDARRRTPEMARIFLKYFLKN